MNEIKLNFFNKNFEIKQTGRLGDEEMQSKFRNSKNLKVAQCVNVASVGGCFLGAQLVACPYIFFPPSK